MKVRASIAALALCCASSLSPLFAADDNPMGAKPEVARGVWCSDFTAAKAVADAQNIPMLVFWASKGCSFCEKLETACRTAAFRDWMAERQLIMVFGYGTGTAADKACKAFAKNSSGLFPYMAVYWKANKSGATVLEKFSGRSGSFGHGTSKSQELWEQFAGAVDSILADWDPSGADPDPDPEPEPPAVVRVGGTFLVPDVAGSRLEAIAGVTAAVEVPLVRTNASCVVTNVLTVGTSAPQDVVWDVGETNKAISVETSQLAEGDALTLTLSLDGAVVGTTAIHGVTEGANASANPKAPGETFDFGEWTLDYDAARQMAATRTGAKLLVMFSGPLWCPYCIGIENSLLNTDDFRQWARDNRVVLALIEQGRASTPATARGLRGPRLTTYDPDPKKLAAGECVSGAAYRSRKGITEAQATHLIEQGAAYAVRWLEPGSAAARPGNPTILLVDPATETVCARFNAYREGTAYDVAENLARLDALLAKAGQTEANRYPQTTTLVHALSSTTAFALDVNEASVSYAFAPRVGAIDFALQPDVAGDVFTLAVYRGAELLASGTNAVSLVATAADVAAGLFVKVSKAFAKGERTATGAFSSAYRPLDTDNEFVTQALSTVVAVAEDGVTRGTVTVTSTRKGKVRAKFFDVQTQKSVSLTGYWTEPDELGTAVFAAKKAKDGLTLRLELAATGDLLAAVTQRSADASAAFACVGMASVADVAYASFAGCYTVALPVESADGALAQGAGTVVVKANTSMARKSGRVMCTVLFPDGKSRSVRGQLTSGAGGFANLTLTVKSGKEVFVIPLAVRPNAALAPTHRAVVAQPGCSAIWISRDKKTPFAASCGIYGSRYDKDESLINCCGTTELALAFGLDAAEADGAAVVSALGEGATFDVTDRKIAVAKKVPGLALSFSRTSGTFSGKTRLELSDARVVSAKLKGVVFFDWYDCGCFEDDETVPLETSLAHAYGTCVFTDKVNGRTVTRSIPFCLKVQE